MNKTKYLIKINQFYVVKNGELRTTYDKTIQRNVYLSGAKMTLNRNEATEFESITEASKYQSLLGIKGKRGQILRSDKK